MVLANGEIIEVNDTEHTDLLWGIKGGEISLPILVDVALTS